MKFISTIFALLALLTIATAAASSRDKFDYIALSVHKGSVKDFDFSPTLDFSTIESFGEKAESSKLSGRLFYGHQFNQYLALEAGLNRFLAKDYTVFEQTLGANNALVTKNIYTGGFSAFGGDLRVVGTYPVTNNFYLKTNVGALAWRSEIDRVSRQNTGLVATKNEESGVALIAGLGLAYGIEKTVAISLDVETTEVSDIRVTNFGLSLTFRI